MNKIELKQLAKDVSSLEDIVSRMRRAFESELAKSTLTLEEIWEILTHDTTGKIVLVKITRERLSCGLREAYEMVCEIEKKAA